MIAFKDTIKSVLYAVVPTLRMKTVTRISLDRTLVPILKHITVDTVLDVGSNMSPYKRYLSHKRYIRLDIDGNSQPDIIADLHDTHLPSDTYDCVLATEVLEHLYDPQRAVNEIHRILKPGGICILSTRFFYVYHPSPKDYYRFTADSLHYLFRHFSSTEIQHHGNLIQALWQLLCDKTITAIFCNLLNPFVARFHCTHTRYPLGFVVVAKKQKDGA